MHRYLHALAVRLVLQYAINFVRHGAQIHRNQFQPQLPGQPPDPGFDLFGRSVRQPEDRLGHAEGFQVRQAFRIGTLTERDDPRDVEPAFFPPDVLETPDVRFEIGDHRRGHPAVGVPGDPAERLFRAARADDYRDPRLCRFRPGPAGPERHEFPGVAGLFGRPQCSHRLEVLAQDGPALATGDAVIGHLVDVPAEPDAERHPPAGEVVEAGDRLGERDRVALHRQRDRGGEPDPAGHRGGGGEGDPRIERPQVSVVGQGPVAGLWMRRLPFHRDVGVLGHVERIEPGGLGDARRLRRGDTPVTGEQHDGMLHAAERIRTRSSFQERGTGVRRCRELTGLWSGERRSS